MAEKLDNPKVTPQPQGQAKRPYAAPRLTEYGNVAKLTAGSGGTVFDPGHSSYTKNTGSS